MPLQSFPSADNCPGVKLALTMEWGWGLSGMQGMLLVVMSVVHPLSTGPGAACQSVHSWWDKCCPSDSA